MLTLYFSGTGNSKFVAEQLAEGLGGACHSIEETVDFNGLLQAADTVAFVYPIYVSRMPRILRAFLAAHRASLHGKKLVILCTQMRFSGDGARCLTDQLEKGTYEVLYAEHITMPNNGCNMPGHRQDRAEVRRITEAARRKVETVCADIRAGRIKRRGFTIGSRTLGLLQAGFSPLMERMTKDGVHVSDACNGCGLCVSQCPMHNLSLENGRAVGHGNCTMCYRCMNRCPQRAINIGFRGKVKWQYPGIPSER